MRVIIWGGGCDKSDNLKTDNLVSSKIKHVSANRNKENDVWTLNITYKRRIY